MVRVTNLFNCSTTIEEVRYFHDYYVEVLLLYDEVLLPQYRIGFFCYYYYYYYYHFFFIIFF